VARIVGTAVSQRQMALKRTPTTPLPKKARVQTRAGRAGHPTPRVSGFRFPAEWEPQVAVWLSWPHNRATWPGRYRVIPAVFAGIAAQITRFEAVRINCALTLQPRARRFCAGAGAVETRLRFFDHPTDDVWCRDHGPIFLKHERSGEVALVDWRFNAWGGKYPPWDRDDRIPARIARGLGLRRFANSMVLEGGSIDGNGRGLLLTSEQCLLHPNRNPHLDRPAIERNLREYLGAESILWIGEGILGDDTDGHVDDTARFFKPDGIVACVEADRRDGNHRALAENLRRLRRFRTPSGARLDIAELPMPRRVTIRGRRLPASYANFLIVNGAVLVPVFRQPRRDARACGILADCFPGREIVPMDCTDLVFGFGALHCISQQQPA
jgi:agmatine deiminase